MPRVYHTRPGWLPADAPYEIEVVIGQFPGKAERVGIVLRDSPKTGDGHKTTAPRTAPRNCGCIDEALAQQLMEPPLAMLLTMDRAKGEPWAADFDYMKWERERAYNKAVRGARKR
jgi:hypothetical protein